MPLGYWLTIQLEKVFMKKKKINVLTVLFISHESVVKNFLKWNVNQCFKGTH